MNIPTEQAGWTTFQVKKCSIIAVFNKALTASDTLYLLHLIRVASTDLFPECEKPITSKQDSEI